VANYPVKDSYFTLDQLNGWFFYFKYFKERALAYKLKQRYGF